ncbi:CCA tRNA nucleotidyltransferase [Roseovarius sp. A21]|uniref:CCA tRNA nucleotidyltransferase n=1 Tax=Roseovarius bejariae TaxID=2576383 RepID=A0A844CJR4_9RHOB|nr:CCA tRNA nucleotidyltransferase [Roseovarius bejariae]MRU15571.1 CCA tRNA nucleotidyltransferase [Roseovarius bejariae]
MKVTGDWITAKPTQAVCRMLESAGFQALFVGGCVRNALLEAPVADIDIATDAPPETVVQLAEQAGFKPVPTGIEHGTVTIVSDGLPHEVTTFREDVETFGRHATVAFSTDVAEDARRRDFTMNALYARSDGTVIDPLGGLPDLKARRVRFIEDPGQRIREDYLRILRFFRFHAWYGDPQAGLDAEGLAAVAQHLDGLSGLSRERVGAEFVKLLSAPDPAPSVAAMRACGVLMAVLPGADDRALAPLVHLEGMAGAAPDGMRRLAALGGDALQERFRLSKAQARRATMLRSEATGLRAPAELGYRFGETDGQDILLLRAALLEQPWSDDDLEPLRKGATVSFPLKAADLMPAYEGPRLGERLRELEQRWIDSGFALTRDDMLAE